MGILHQDGVVHFLNVLFETLTHQRDEIEMFCRNFLHRNGYKQLHELIGNYEREFSQIDIQQFTQDTFNGSFRRICGKVFTRTPISNAYIIAVLGFSETVHKYHCSSSWYTIDILMHSLVNILEGIDFHPVSYCIIL